MHLTKRGGMWFWRIGPFGGSFFRTSKPLRHKRLERPTIDVSGGMLGL